MPALDVLVRALGADLVPVTAPLPHGLEVTAVHVSELTDPTPYLGGGELLLTTGMGLTGQTAQARAYTARLSRLGVAGLGIGLGPVHTTVPPTLAEACAAVGLPLLVVPAPTPFLVVARRFWSLLAEAGKEQLNATLGAHRDLVRSAAGPDPVPDVVRTLAGAVEGWAAQLDADGELVEVWPRDREPVARQVAVEAARLRVAGPHSSATFALGGDDVVLQPLASRGRLSGFVATGGPGPMQAPDRQLLLTACALLALHSEHNRRGADGARAARACVVRLLMAGYPDAARALAAELGLPPTAPRVRVLGFAGPPDRAGDDLLDVLERVPVSAPAGPAWTTGPSAPSGPSVPAAPPDQVASSAPAACAGPSAPSAPSASRAATASPSGRLLAVAEPDEVWALVGPGDAAAVLGAVRRYVGGRAAESRALLSGETDLAELPRSLPALRRTLAGLPGGTVHDLGEGPAPGTPAGPPLEPLLGYRRADLVGAVAAYLRHRGHWERAAADLGVHRNTLRHRITTATRLLGADLDDPDVASLTWLALRERGLA